MSAWLCGCSCHEADLMAGRAFECPWKGCRAASYASRCSTLCSVMQAARDAQQPLPGFSQQDTFNSWAKMLAIFRLKAAWANEAPYLIWMADKSEVAQQILDSYDVDITAGRVPHRVTSHLAAPSSPLRPALTAHAAGHGMSSELQCEVMSYQCGGSSAPGHFWHWQEEGIQQHAIPPGHCPPEAKSCFPGQPGQRGGHAILRRGGHAEVEEHRAASLHEPGRQTSAS